MLFREDSREGGHTGKDFRRELDDKLSSPCGRMDADKLPLFLSKSTKRFTEMSLIFKKHLGGAKETLLILCPKIHLGVAGASLMPLTLFNFREAVLIPNTS